MERCRRCTAPRAPGRPVCLRHVRKVRLWAKQERKSREAAGTCVNCREPAVRARRCQLHWHLAMATGAVRHWRGRIVHKIVGRKLRPIAKAIFLEPETLLADIARRFGVAPTIVSQIRIMARLPPRGKRGPRQRDEVTQRAAQIRALVAGGMTHAQAASHLGISLNMLRKTLAARRADPWYPRPTSFFQE